MSPSQAVFTPGNRYSCLKSYQVSNEKRGVPRDCLAWLFHDHTSDCLLAAPRAILFWLPQSQHGASFVSFLFRGTVGSFECPGVSKLARGPHIGLGLFLCCLWTQNSFYIFKAFLKKERDHFSSYMSASLSLETLGRHTSPSPLLMDLSLCSLLDA